MRFFTRSFVRAEIFVCVVHGCSLVPHTPEIFVELDIFFHIYLWRLAATFFPPLIIKAVKILFMFFHDFIRTSQLLNENVFWSLGNCKQNFIIHTNITLHFLCNALMFALPEYSWKQFLLFLRLIYCPQNLLKTNLTFGALSLHFSWKPGFLFQNLSWNIIFQPLPPHI